MPYSLIFPMFALVILTFIVGLVSLLTRVHAVRKDGLDFRYFKTFSVGEPSHRVLQAGRHFDNMFEVPTLFYAGCLAAMMVGADAQWSLVFAWGFVVTRVAHAWIHLGSNRIFPRMSAFFLGFAFVLALWITIVVKLI